MELQDFINRLHYLDIDNGWQPLKLYPRQDILLRHVDYNDNVVCRTTRQVGYSTITIIAALYKALSKPDTKVALFDIKNTITIEMMRRMSELYKRCFSGDIGIPHITKQTKNLIEFDNGSSIRGIGSTGSSLRGFSYDVAFVTTYSSTMSKTLVSENLSDYLHLINIACGQKIINIIYSEDDTEYDNEAHKHICSMIDGEYCLVDFPLTVNNGRDEMFISKTKEIIGDNYFKKEFTIPSIVREDRSKLDKFVEYVKQFKW